MSTNNSPWIAQLKDITEFPTLNFNTNADVVIVGAGIAGITTSYFLLTKTDKNIILVGADKVAHGATGHNGGFLAGYFERQISSLYEEYGEEKAADAQRSIDSAWELLDDIFKFANLITPMHQFIGYAGCRDVEETITHLQNRKLANKMGLIEEPIYLADDFVFPSKLLAEYKGFYAFVKRDEILDRLESKDQSYISCITSKKGVMNSALFCHELLSFLVTKYSERLQVYEKSKVIDISLYDESAALKINDREINCSKVILCTNGFENFSITNMVGEDINTSFHQNVKGAIGYMAAYLDKQKRQPIEISYLPEKI
jgi:glycine/D-amino acid oxidase-like deaminating enzyme